MSMINESDNDSAIRLNKTTIIIKQIIIVSGQIMCKLYNCAVYVYEKEHLRGMTLHFQPDRQNDAHSAGPRACARVS